MISISKYYMFTVQYSFCENYRINMHIIGGFVFAILFYY